MAEGSVKIFQQNQHLQSDDAVKGSYLDPKFIAEREKCWVKIEGKLVFIGCGDDRPITEASAYELANLFKSRGKVLNPLYGYASVYGGLVGEAKNILIVGCAQYGAEFIDNVGGFEEIIDLLIRRSHSPQTIHSAATNEKDERHFCLEGNLPVGCAYCNGVAILSSLFHDPDNELVSEVGRQDQKYIFGSDFGFDDLIEAHRTVLEHIETSLGTSFSFGRQSYVKDLQQHPNQLGVMILSGSHAKSNTTGVISNFSLDEVGSPNTAHQFGLDFYRLDIAKVTEIVLDALKEKLNEYGYKLSAEMLMRSFLLDATAVRAELAAIDATHTAAQKVDPRPLALGKRGNPWDAINKLTA